MPSPPPNHPRHFHTPALIAALLVLAAVPMLVLWSNARAVQASVMVQQMRRAQAQASSGGGPPAAVLERGVTLARQFDAIDPLTAFHAAMILLTMGSPGAAAELMELHLGDMAHAAPAVRLLLRARAAQGQWYEALAPARLLVHLMPQPAHQGGRLHWAAGRAFDAAGMPATAQRAMLHGVGLGDEREQLFLDLSAMAHASGHHEIERAWLIRALRITPRTSTLQLLRRWYEITGDLDGLRRALMLARGAGARMDDMQSLQMGFETAGDADAAAMIAGLK